MEALLAALVFLTYAVGYGLLAIFIMGLIYSGVFLYLLLEEILFPKEEK
jgi:hypothetical protein